MSVDTVIEFRDASFSYRDRALLEHANLAVAQGSLTALIGDNGVGKSTALKLVLGEERPSMGKVLVFGEDPSRMRFDGKVGFVAQQTPDDYRTFPVTVFELVVSGTYPLSGLFCPYTRRLKAKARVAIESVGLSGFEKSLLGELSGGQLQRALLARALVCKPRLLLLDEPTSNLDAQGAASLVDLVASLAASTKAAVVMVTHDIARLPDRFDQIIELRGQQFHSVKAKEK